MWIIQQACCIEQRLSNNTFWIDAQPATLLIQENIVVMEVSVQKRIRFLRLFQCHEKRLCFFKDMQRQRTVLFLLHSFKNFCPLGHCRELHTSWYRHREIFDEVQSDLRRLFIVFLLNDFQCCSRVNPFKEHGTKFFICMKEPGSATAIQYSQSFHLVQEFFVRVSNLQNCLAAIFSPHSGDIVVRKLKRFLCFKMPKTLTFFQDGGQFLEPFFTLFSPI